MQVSSLKGRYKGEAVQSNSIENDNTDNLPRWLLQLMIAKKFTEDDNDRRFFMYRRGNLTDIVEVGWTDWIVHLDDDTTFVLSDSAFHILYAVR